MLFINILFFYSFISLILCSNERKLIFVYSHFTSGASAPSLNNDNNKDIFGTEWMNPGELTNIGERMHYILGMYNKERYIKNNTLLNENFDPHEIYIVTFDWNRTVESVLAQINGMFPLGTGKEIEENQKKYAIPPIKSINMSLELQDNISSLNNTSFSLPQQQNIIPIHFHPSIDCSSTMDKYIEKNKKEDNQIKKTLNDMKEKYDQKLKNFFDDIKSKYEFTFEGYEDICGPFIFNIINVKDLSILETKYSINLNEFFQDCKNFLNISLFNKDFGDKERKFLNFHTSHYIENILLYAQNAINQDKIGKLTNNYNNPKMLLFSGHDGTLGSLELKLKDTFHFEKLIYPLFASSLNIELYKKNNLEKNDSKDSDYEIEIYFDGEYLVTVQYDEFKQNLSKNLLSENEIESFCNLKPYLDRKKIKKFKNLSVTFIVFTIILIIIVIILIGIIIYTKKINNDKSTFSKLLNEN